MRILEFLKLSKEEQFKLLQEMSKLASEDEDYEIFEANELLEDEDE